MYHHMDVSLVAQALVWAQMCSSWKFKQGLLRESSQECKKGFNKKGTFWSTLCSELDGAFGHLQWDA